MSLGKILTSNSQILNHLNNINICVYTTMPIFDLITRGILNELTKVGVISITQIMNFPFWGHYATQWKTVKIIVIPKPCKPPTELSSY